MNESSQVVALVDGRVIDHPTAGGRGVGRYTIGFVRAMQSAGISTTVLCSTNEQHRRWNDAIPEVSTSPFLRDVFEAARDSDPWFICTQLMLHPVPLDVIPRVVTDLDMKVAAIMYDVIPQRFPDIYLSDPSALIQSKIRTLLARTIDKILAISTFSAETSIQELGLDRDRIAVVGSVVDPKFQDIRNKFEESHSPLRKSRDVVCVVDSDPRKNLERLILAWAHLAPSTRRLRKLNVIYRGSPQILARWERLADESGVGDNIRFMQGVTDDELVAVIRAAAIGVMPSLEEGFGLPIAEMVACGTPVLCSSTSSMPEVAGCDDALFDPYDVEDMARLLERALNDEQFRQRVLVEETARLQRWTVRHVGGEILAALRKPTRPRRPRSERPMSVAFAAPHPQSNSGIGVYTKMVLDKWPLEDEIISLDDCSATGERLLSRPSQRPVVGAGSIGRTFRSHDVDHLVIALGSSEHHAVSLERAATGGAHLWLHEATALGAVIGPAHVGGGERWARQRFSVLGIDIPEDVEVMNPKELHAQHVTVLDNAMLEARSLIVTSQQSVDALTEAFGPALPPTVVIPLAHPDRRQTAVGGNRVISFGVIDDNKRPNDLIEMLVACEEIHLELIGAITDKRRAQLVHLAEQHDVSNRLTIHGRIDDDVLDDLFQHVRCAVQLREGHPGQMSAAICELLARGIPVVTNMTTHGEGHEGLVVVDGNVDSVVRVVDRFGEETYAQNAGAVARAHAEQWTSTDVAAALRSWLVAQRLPVLVGPT